MDKAFQNPFDTFNYRSPFFENIEFDHTVTDELHSTNSPIKLEEEYCPYQPTSIFNPSSLSIQTIPQFYYPPDHLAPPTPQIQPQFCPLPPSPQDLNQFQISNYFTPQSFSTSNSTFNSRISQSQYQNNGDSSTSTSTSPGLSPSHSLPASPPSTTLVASSKPQIMPYRAGVTPFATKLYWILGQEEYKDVIRWSTCGQSFIVDMAHEKFINNILPSYFNHKNLSSFNRQLQLYSFKRLSTEQVQMISQSISSTTQSQLLKFREESDWRGYSHEFMKRGDSSNLGLMKPKQSKARMEDKSRGKKRQVSKSIGGRSSSRGSSAKNSTEEDSEFKEFEDEEEEENV